MTFSAVLVFLKGLWSNIFFRYFLIGILVVILASFLYKHQMKKAYDEGVAYQISVNQKEQEALKEKYEKMLEDANQERIGLNEEIEKQKEAYAKLQAERNKKSSEIQDKVNNYAKTIDGSKRCLSSSWMQLYKDSLPE